MSSYSIARDRAEWFTSLSGAKRDILAGMVGTFALIPEVIAFSFVAGMSIPEVGLFASFVIGVVIAFTGGRPAMISGAAGSVALVAAALVHAHGLQYLLRGNPAGGTAFQVVVRPAAARHPDALRLALGPHRLRQRPRHPDLFRTSCRRCSACHLGTPTPMIALGLAIIYLAPSPDDGDPLAADLHPGADGALRDRADAAPHHRRPRPPARRAARASCCRTYR